MLLIVILNVLFLWIISAKSEYYETFASKEVRQLNDGNIIPIPAYGTTAQRNELGELAQAVLWALESGYRTIDTDNNEDLIGQAINNATKRGIVTREKIFIIVKVPLDVNKGKKVIPALRLLLKKMQLQYIDLLLINTPNNMLRNNNIDILEIWNGMEDAKRLGLTKSIGVVDFKREHFKLILPYCTTKPAVNQIEVNPTFTNTDLVEYCQKQGILVMAYGPLGFTVPRQGVVNRPPPSLDDPVLVKMAKKYGVTTSQVVLRYSIDLGTLPISRSTNKEHIRLNRNILDFSLTDQEVERIKKFNINRPVFPPNKTTIATDYRNVSRKSPK